MQASALEWAIDTASIPAVRAALLLWYEASHRDLPWRRTNDPYAIWVSEIMLQQTRVAAVIGHYERFLRRYPTALSLSLAPVEDLLAMWSGLGYYRRARLLHHAAKMLVAEHGGQVPASYEKIRAMPGIGPYTSAALGSIAFGLPYAAVDGNVERVLARVYGLPGDRGAPHWRRHAQEWLDPERPGDWNQAMMELGAQVCTPRSPRCPECPLFQWCATRGEHVTVPRLEMRSVQEARALVERGRGATRQVYLQQRGAGERKMAGLWELPVLLQPPAIDPPMVLRHSITNTSYYVRVFLLPREAAEAEGVLAPTETSAYVRLARLRELPLTGLTLKILRRSGHLPTAGV